MKKLILRGAFLMLLTTGLLFSCQENQDTIEDVSVEAIDILKTGKESGYVDPNYLPAYIGDRIGGPLNPWIYWLDARYSRTCSTGPGVCFKNGDGEPWDWVYINNVPTSDEIEETNPDFDEGGVMIGLEGDQVRMIFTKDVESESIYIDEEFTLPEGMFSNFVEGPITVLAGEYKLNFDNYKYGEVVFKVAAPQTSISFCDVYLTNRVENGQPVFPADVLNFRIKMHPYWYNLLKDYPNWYCGYVYARFPGSSVVHSFPLKQLLPNNEAVFSNGLASLLPLSGGGAPLNYQIRYGVVLKSSTGANCSITSPVYNSVSLSDLNAFFTNTLTSCYHQ